MNTKKGLLIAGLAVLTVCGSGCAKSQTWTGEISDAMCGGDHRAMGGLSDHDCAIACVRQMRSRYILVVDPKTSLLAEGLSGHLQENAAVRHRPP